MMSNFSKARDKLKMVLDDLRRSISRYFEGDFPDSIFRMQLAVENACKSILSFLGVEYELTHFPSTIISHLLSDKSAFKRYGFKKEHTNYLLQVITYASSLETQGSMPRYGWETEERIILPREIYDENLAKMLIRDGLLALKNVSKFFKLFELPRDVRTEVEKLNHEVERALKKLG